MTDYPAGFEPKFLLESELRARVSREESLRNNRLQKSIRLRLRRYLSDPFLRGICELRCNGATDFQSALSLKQAGMIEVDLFCARQLDFENKSIQVVRLNSAGLSYLASFGHQYQYDEEPDRPFDAFDALVAGVCSYICIDRGNGIVVTRDLAEVSLDLYDGDVLARTMNLSTLDKQFHSPLQKLATKEDRLDVEDAWSYSFALGRTGAAVIDLSGIQNNISTGQQTNAETFA